jgi:hypothetical protein
MDDLRAANELTGTALDSARLLAEHRVSLALRKLNLQERA